MSNIFRKIRKNIMETCWKCPHVSNCPIQIGMACIYAGGTIDPKEYKNNEAR